MKKIKKTIMFIAPALALVSLAACEPIKTGFNITWANYDGSELMVSKVNAGTMPEYTGEVPTKPDSGIYKYTFKGWTPEVVAAKEDTTYTAEYYVVATASTLNEIVANANSGDEIVLENSATAYTLPTISNKELTFIGDPTNSENVKVNDSTAQGMPGATLNFKNLTVVGKESEAYVGYQHISKETYENCILTGHRKFYAGETVVNNSVFKDGGAKYFCWTYNPNGTYTFNNCTFNSSNGYAVKLYNESTSSESEETLSFNNCTFTAPVDNTKNKPAIAANSLGMKFTVTINNCTATNFAVAEDDAMTDWYTTRMASATDQQKMLFGAEGVIANISLSIDGTTF